MQAARHGNFQRVLLTLCVIAATASTAGAKTVYVSTAGNDANDGLTWATAKRTVQIGLNTAAASDQVWVAAGTYVENITLKAEVALYGGFAGTETDLAQRNWKTNVTTLDGNQAGSVVTSPAGATATTCVDGFTIRNGSGTLVVEWEPHLYGGGVFCWASSPTIANNVLTDNVAGFGGGAIACLVGSSPSIVANQIIGNKTLTNDGGGAYYGKDCSPIIANNLFALNSAGTKGGGVYGIGSSGSALIVNNTIYGNEAVEEGGGIRISGGTAFLANNVVAFNSSGCSLPSPTIASVRRNCVFGNTRYNYSGIADPTGTDGNIAADPKFASLAYGNSHLQPDSPCIDAGDDSVVQASWLDVDGQPRMQGAHVDIGADESDGTVWPGGSYVIVRVKPDGDDAKDGSSWALAKRTVQAGIDAAAESGGEVWVSAGTYAGLVSLRPYVYVYGGFAGHEASREERRWASHISILDGQQLGSVVTAVSCGHRLAALDGFTIRNGNGTLDGTLRFGGGVYCARSSPRIENCVITGNAVSGDGGGVYCGGSFAAISNIALTANRARNGGAMYLDGKGETVLTYGPYLANLTAVGNAATAGGGVYCATGVPNIVNVIVAFNTSGVYGRQLPSPPRCCCVYGNTAYNYRGGLNPTGTKGNVSVDPKFAVSPSAGADGVWGTADDSLGDLHLQDGSPCVDTGAAWARAYYVTGSTRTDGAPDTGIVDMGFHDGAEPMANLPAAQPAFDADGDIDGADYGIFAACFNGTGNPIGPDCAAADLDDDNDVDGADYGLFASCFNGTGNPPACR